MGALPNAVAGHACGRHDTPSTVWTRLGSRDASGRDVPLHVITETACHAGRLDAAREPLYGRRWMVLT
ncbi:DUF664 domain-containing protein [Streptomyces sp. DH41]|nr:DUF664 domain-containing protein [Streptomyces sp. DH41]MDG9727507.1 DUF664 domain-containing protein [Streptomyces sp. DH41]